MRGAFAVAAKDVRVEHRSKTALVSAIGFAVLVLVIFNFARDAAAVSREVLAPSVLWITFTFSGVIALNRSFTLERDNAALDGLLLAPVSRSALFLGKYLANLAFVFTMEAVALPLFVLFFGVDLGGRLPAIGLVAALALRRPELAIVFIIDLFLTGFLAAPLLLCLIRRVRPHLVWLSQVSMACVAAAR